VYKYKLKKLSSGLRILLVPSPESLSVQVMVLVNAGSDFETKKINGISHFLEHMCFKGTKKRPSSMSLARELDAVGSSYNAFTSQEFTGYYVRLAKDKWELAVDIVSDIYLNSQFPEKAIREEKGVILEEINMYRDEPASIINDYWLHLLYGDQPAGRPTLGSKTNVRHFKRDDLFYYRRLHYLTRSTLLVISGNFPERKIMARIRKFFTSLRQGEGKKKIPVREGQKRPRIFWKNKKTNQSHLLLGFRGSNLFDERKYPLALANIVLIGGISSRLWQKIREELGAAYYLQGELELFTDHGFWAVKAGISNYQVEKVVGIILKEFKRLREEFISEKELEKAKNYIKGTMSLQLEDVHDFANFLSLQELLEKKIETPAEYWRKINRVTTFDIRKAMGQMLVPSNLNLAIIGPSSPKREVKKLLSSFPN